MIDGHTALIEDISDLKKSVNQLESSSQATTIGFVGIGLGIVGIVIASFAISKTKNRN